MFKLQTFTAMKELNKYHSFLNNYISDRQSVVFLCYRCLICMLVACSCGSGIAFKSLRHVCTVAPGYDFKKRM